MPGLGAIINALSGWAVHRKGVVHTSPGEPSHIATCSAGAGPDCHPALSQRLAQTGREQQPPPLARP
jgi:hypothetical protein